VLGSRYLGVDTLKQGMPWWKVLGNELLTKLGNWMMGLNFAEYHTGYQAFSRRTWEEIPFALNSDNFAFDQETLVPATHLGFTMIEVPVPTNYLPEASNASRVDSIIYGWSILFHLGRFIVHRIPLIELRQFQSFISRYRRVQ
jgi:hypothetical protein